MTENKQGNFEMKSNEEGDAMPHSKRHYRARGIAIGHKNRLTDQQNRIHSPG